MSLASVSAALIVLSFGVFTLFTGLFAAYFGAGKSRKIGLALTLVGLLVMTFFISSTWQILPGYEVAFWEPGDALIGLAGVIGAGIGATVATLLFLFSIMKA